MPTEFIIRFCRALMFFTLAGATTSAGPTTARDVHLSVSAIDVSLHEPVFAYVQIVNDGKLPIDLDLGKDRKCNFVVSFKGPNGRTGKNIELFCEGIGTTGNVTIAGGAAYQQALLLNDWIPFDRSGKYHITVRLENSLAGNQQNAHNNSLVSEFEVNILPFDANRLQGVCDSLEQKIESTDNAGTILEAARVLSSVVDETAVPYLERSFSKGMFTAPIVIPTLEKIGSRAAARVLIKSLNQLTADYLVLARNALIHIQAQTSDSSLRTEIERALHTSS